MNKIDFSRFEKQSITHCPCCNVIAATVIDLPKYPLTEFYKDIAEETSPYGFLDQEVRFCSSCNHLFLKKVLDAQQIYSHYLTSTMSSRGAVVCLENFVRFIEKSTKNLQPYSLIDIGGNDSTFLEYFDGRVKNLINIDANASTKNPAIQIRKCFLEEVEFSEFDSITPKIFASSHTIEHLEQPVLLLEKLEKIVGRNDVIYLQFPSLELLVQQRRFDQICHQHLNYFSLTSISKTLNRFGLYINDFEFDSTHFGTLRLRVSRSESSSIAGKTFTALDVSDAFASFQNYYSSLNSVLSKTVENGQGFGAGLMVPILAYHLPIVNQLSRIIDENPSRLNKRFINCSPPILGIDELDRDLPVLVTAISTKDASRAIFAKLNDLGIRDICIPAAVI